MQSGAVVTSIPPPLLLGDAPPWDGCRTLKSHDIAQLLPRRDEVVRRDIKAAQPNPEHRCRAAAAESGMDALCEQREPKPHSFQQVRAGKVLDIGLAVHQLLFQPLQLPLLLVRLLTVGVAHLVR
eukprot:5610750-Prymnesium_polylepis.1